MSSSFFFYVIMAFCGLSGLYGLITGKQFFLDYGRYTPESIAKFSRPGGLVSIIIAASASGAYYMLRPFIADHQYAVLFPVCGIIAIIAIIVYTVLLKKVLVKVKRQ